MPRFDLPLAITYQTDGATPVAEVAAALLAADRAIREALDLIPSFVGGLSIEYREIRVLSIVQQSPLRELFAISLVAAYQDDLKTEIPPLIEHLLGVDIPSNVDSVVTILVMIIVFYGASFLKDAAEGAVTNGRLKEQMKKMVADLAERTGKTPAEVKRILAARYAKPGPVKILINTVRDFFIPAQRDGGAPIVFDRERVHAEVIREIPYPGGAPNERLPERYDPYDDVGLEIHAQDRDKSKTGWAAVPEGICVERLRMRLVEPLSAADLWNRDHVQGDIVVVSKLTLDGYVPTEIHLLRVKD